VQRPLGTVVIGGIVTSTALALLLNRIIEIASAPRPSCTVQRLGRRVIRVMPQR